MRTLLWISLSLASVAVLAAAGGVMSLPGARPRGLAAPAISAEERAAVLAQLRPPKRARPVVAVLASNLGTETTDFLVPFGVLAESGAVDVFAVAPRADTVELMPALRVRPQLDFAAFDARFPDGADYVIVPALHRADDPAVLAWLQQQARGGALAIGICEGARVLAHAGLLDGRSATTHWFSLDKLQHEAKGMTWQRDRRYVVDRGVVTTTGISASIPLSLTLVEAVAGRERAEALARAFGVTGFAASHASAEYALDRSAAGVAIGNTLAFWSHETVDVPLDDGVDEVALALTADAWKRTYRASVRAVSPAAEVRSRHGLILLADGPGAPSVALPPAGTPAIDAVLAAIDRRYGPATADFVALQLEYDPGPARSAEAR